LVVGVKRLVVFSARDDPSCAYVADLLGCVVENPLEDDDVTFGAVAFFEIVPDAVAEMADVVVSRI
jgi:hypothetical protein